MICSGVCRAVLDRAVRDQILGFRERAAAGSAEELAVLEMKTEDDTMRLQSVLLSWARFNNMLQLFANRLLRDQWLEKRAGRSFRPYRDLVYIF